MSQKEDLEVIEIRGWLLPRGSLIQIGKGGKAYWLILENILPNGHIVKRKGQTNPISRHLIKAEL